MKLLKTKELTEFSKMVGANLRYIRIHKGLTQTKVSQCLNVTFQQMQKYEAGTNCINAWRLTQLAKFFNFPVSDILDPDLIMRMCNYKGKQEEIKHAIEDDEYEVKRKVIVTETADGGVEVGFDPSKYEEFADEYPAPLSQLENDPKMRATYDAILENKK